MKKYKNPLSIAFGSFLKEERQKMGMSIAECTVSLDMGESLYRMIEGGNANLTVVKLGLLITTFSKCKFVVPQLSNLFIGIQYIDQFLNSNENVTVQEAIINLFQINPELSYAFEDLESMFDKDEIEQKIFLRDKISYRLRDYLLNNYSQESTPRFIRNFENTPTLSLEMLYDFSLILEKHPHLHIGSIAQKWESDNKESFISLRTFALNDTIHITQDNFQKFDWEYLFKNQFEFAHIIYVTDSDPQDVKARFVDKLNKCRIKNRKFKLEKNEIDKITIKTIKNNIYNREIDELLKDPSNIYKDMRGYWSFEMMQSGLNIGFVGARHDDMSAVMNLSHKDNIIKLKRFDWLWDKI